MARTPRELPTLVLQTRVRPINGAQPKNGLSQMEDDGIDICLFFLFLQLVCPPELGLRSGGAKAEHWVDPLGKTNTSLR